MKYRHDWYTVSEAIHTRDWLCASEANSCFYDYAKQLKTPLEIFRAFRDVLGLIQYSDSWPNESLRKANLKSLFDDAETILYSKKNAEKELKILGQYKGVYKIK